MLDPDILSRMVFKIHFERPIQRDNQHIDRITLNTQTIQGVGERNNYLMPLVK